MGHTVGQFVPLLNSLIEKYIKMKGIKKDMAVF